MDTIAASPDQSWPTLVSDAIKMAGELPRPHVAPHPADRAMAAADLAACITSSAPLFTPEERAEFAAHLMGGRPAERSPAETLAPTYHRQLQEAIGLLRELVISEDGPCAFDHHGNCQAHPGAWKDDGTCTTRRARQFLGLDGES